MTLLRPLRTRSFRRLAVAKLASDLADWLLLAALVGWTYSRTASTGAVAALMLLRLAPPLLGGGAAAAIVDRVRKERLLVAVEGARCAAVALALTGLALDRRALVYCALAATGMLATLSGVTLRAFVPAVVAENELPAANAALGTTAAAAMGLGGLAAGIALTAAGAVAALGVVPCLSAMAALLYARLSGLPSDRRQPTRRGIAAGVRHLRARRAVLAAVASFAVATVATGLMTATLPRFLGEELGLGAGAFGFGQAVLAGGLALGELVGGLFPGERISARWLAGGLVAMGACFAGVAASTAAAPALLFLVLVGAADGATEVVFETVVQRECDPGYLGRVFGFAQTSMRTTMMAAVAAAPLLNALASAGTVILLAAVCLLAAGAVAFAGTGRSAPRLGAPVPLPHG